MFLDSESARSSSPTSTSVKRMLSALALCLAGLVTSGIAMCRVTHGTLGAWIALGGMLVALAGAAWLFAALEEDESDRALGSILGTHVDMRERAAHVVPSALVFAGVLVAATHGLVPRAVTAVVLPLSFTFAASHAIVRPGRSVWTSHETWIIALAALVTWPNLGGGGLIDPWESEYADVAREMRARGDFITAIWGHEGWFQSKPVLALWLQAMGMALGGVSPDGGHVLGETTAKALHAAMSPEWVVRTPNVLLAVIASIVLYRGAARSLGRRAAFLGTLVLWTSAHWVLFAHQGIFDMATVAPMAAALGCSCAALATSRDAECVSYTLFWGRKWALRLDARHAVALALFACVLPQVLVLVGTQVSLFLEPHRYGFMQHADAYASGSPGNCTLPGQVPCAAATIAHRRFSPLAQAAVWLFAFTVIVDRVLAERRARRVAFTAAWLCAGVATMGKGLIGIAVPMGGLVAWSLVSAFASDDLRVDALRARLRTLLDARLVLGVSIIALLVLPWYVANFVRHGRSFFDELVMRNMIGRTLEHLHDTNEGEDTSFRYYLWQLGYATFPWSGVVPVAIGSFVARARTAAGRARKNEGALLALVWLVLVLGLVTLMQTKFHHYVFPALPPLALLVGVYLAETKPSRAATLAVATMVLTLVVRDLATRTDVVGEARFVHLFTYQYRRSWPAWVDMRAAIAGLALAFAAASFVLVRRDAFRYLLFVPSSVFALWMGNVYFARIAPHWSQRELVRAFGERRESVDEPLVAYQMNWKGESFYTGNRMAIFVTSGAPVTRYVETERERGRRRLFVVLEHDRIGSLRAEAAGHTVTALTTREANDKFCLAEIALVDRSTAQLQVEQAPGAP